MCPACASACTRRLVSMWHIGVGRFVLSSPVHLRNVTSAADGWSAESFQGLLLRCRGRSRLTQGALAKRVGVHIRSVEDWESGSSYPSAERLRALISALLDAGGLSAGREAREAEALWAAALR